MGPETETVPTLADGSAPATSDDLFARLRELGIETRTVTHPPVYTVEEAKAHRGDLEGAHTKNLFLKSRKSRMALVVCDEDRPIDLKSLGDQVGLGRVSFGSERRLMSHLGVIPGAVTPFSVMNDRGGAVELWLERALLDHEYLNCHPLDNAMTTQIASKDLVAFLEAVGHAPNMLSFE